MIISALNKYYEILAKNNKVPPYGFSLEKVLFEFVIGSDGTLKAIIPLGTESKNSKFSKPKIMLLPMPPKRSGKNFIPCYLYDNVKYAIGLSKKANDKDIKKRFYEFKMFHHEMIDNKNSAVGDIFLEFLDTYDYKKYKEIIDPYYDNLVAGGYIVFSINGKYLHEDEYLKKLWTNKLEADSKDVGQCSITGKFLPIARIHPSIKGLKNGKSSGGSIVSFNKEAYESYNKKQGFNSPISSIVAFNYTTALNYLLLSEKNKIYLGDITTVLWAESDNPGYVDFMYLLFSSPDNDRDRVVDIKTEETILALLKALIAGRKVDYSAYNLNPSTKFCILGLSPNSARIAIRFFYYNTFQEIVEKMVLHFQDMQIEKSFKDYPDSITISQIINETGEHNSDSLNSLLNASIIRSIFNGNLYPRMLLNTIVSRVKSPKGKDKKKKNDYIRVSIIKAYLNRYARVNKIEKLKEVLKVSLNRNSKNVPYLLGRLFAVLEYIQRDAIGNNINSTIRDRYFSSACSTPSAVFPVLLKLAQSHIAKSNYSFKHEKGISEIMDMMEETHFPAHLSLEDQGVFIIGYYHQNNDLYKKNKKEEF